jgi:hypothetical protein
MLSSDVLLLLLLLLLCCDGVLAGMCAFSGPLLLRLQAEEAAPAASPVAGDRPER